MSTEDLRGRVALVTGGSSGIGRSTCLKLADLGVHVAVGYHRDATGAQEVVAGIERAGVRALAVGGDVGSPSAIREMVAAVVDGLGGVDILVSNAGRVEVKDLPELDTETFDATMAEHVRAAFLLAQAVVPGMQERRWGRILLMSSAAAYLGGFVGPHYAAAKAALLGLAHWLSSKYAPDGIAVNAIAPALIDTRVLGDEQRREQLLKRIPVGRFGTVEETAELMVAMLACGYLSNQTILLDGGYRGTP